MSLLVENLRIGSKETGQELVSGVSFHLPQGESLVLLGQSGSGKTLTCRAVMGLLEPKRFSVQGKILLDDRDLLTLSGRERRSVYGGAISFIPQNPMTALDPSMRIGRQMEETLALHSDLSKPARREKIRESLLRAGLTEGERICRAYPHMLSGGMLQRVLIAMVIMGNARIVIADEPTTALDVIHRNETMDSFVKLREEGMGILLVTHDFSAAAQLGGRMLVMKEGRMVEEGTVRQLLTEPQEAYTKDLLSASSLVRVRMGGGA